MKLSMIAIAAAGLAFGTSAMASDGAELAKKNACMACHDVSAKKVGPAFKDIAAKYASDKDAAAKLAKKVKEGGSGVWGTVNMPPNPHIKDDDIKAMVAYVLSVK